ncbi:MAG: glutathione S-transferase family protein [Pseudomonadota bacterium]
MKIYGDIKSGNCYKIALTAAILNIEHEWVDIDILKNETGTKAFLQKNPNGKVPLLELDDGRCLSESNAIVNYLARDSALVPNDAFTHAKMLEWQFFEQYSHEPFIAVARFIAKYQGMPEERKAEYEAKQPGGHKALGIMEAQLMKTPYLLGEQLSVADISLYGYTHVADEGGFDLSTYPAILSWLARIQAEPNYVAMTQGA